ncbi:MAG: (d)CMP kinase [Pseudomonadota bacterium]
MTKSLVIAIDGPSASGKGTLAKRIAAHFNVPYLNTGALYRLVAFRVMERGIAPAEFEEHISELVKNISESDLEPEELFSEKVGAVASIIAKNPKLRAALFDFQKDFVAVGKKEKGGAVLDGRDTTTVICPDADYKFFVTADVEIRAKRRFLQLNTSFDEILAQLKKRDENDLNREDAPLKVADGAVVIDNGNLTVEEGFQKILQTIK